MATEEPSPNVILAGPLTGPTIDSTTCGVCPKPCQCREYGDKGDQAFCQGFHLDVLTAAMALHGDATGSAPDTYAEWAGTGRKARDEDLQAIKERLIAWKEPTSDFDAGVKAMLEAVVIESEEWYAKLDALDKPDPCCDCQYMLNDKSCGNRSMWDYPNQVPTQQTRDHSKPCSGFLIHKHLDR